jgi:hypothetical protein
MLLLNFMENYVFVPRRKALTTGLKGKDRHVYKINVTLCKVYLK